jgi:hypothetical protein
MLEFIVSNGKRSESIKFMREMSIIMEYSSNSDQKDIGDIIENKITAK